MCIRHSVLQLGQGQEPRKTAYAYAYRLVQLRAIPIYDIQPKDLVAPVCCNVR
jgi:hypothetical protein